MSYIFDYSEMTAIDQKIQLLEADIKRFTNTNLIDAQYALKTLMIFKKVT